MHLADAFIQSDLQHIQVIIICQYVLCQLLGEHKHIDDLKLTYKDWMPQNLCYKVFKKVWLQKESLFCSILDFSHLSFLYLHIQSVNPAAQTSPSWRGNWKWGEISCRRWETGWPTRRCWTDVWRRISISWGNTGRSCTRDSSWRVKSWSRSEQHKARCVYCETCLWACLADLNQ